MTAGKVHFVVVTLLFAAAASLAAAVSFGLTAQVDRVILLAASPPPALVPLASAITWCGDSLTRIIVALLVALALLMSRQPRRAAALLFVVSGGAALDSAMKAIVGRPRPALLPHLDNVTSASFPSGHAANGAMLYLAIAFLVPPRFRTQALIAAGVLACAIGVSRVVLAVHWPSDVLAGWCLGVGWLALWRHQLTPAARG